MNKKYIIAIMVITLTIGIALAIIYRDSLLNFNKPQATQEAKTISEANNEFALELYAQLRKEDGNIFFSPYSISSALAMTYEGAREQTASQMQKVLRFPEDDEVRRQGFSDLNDLLNAKNNKYKLQIANALWTEKSIEFFDDYMELVEKHYGGQATSLDFQNDAEKSRKTINKWVEDNTNNMIKDLLSEGSVNEETRLVLTNAIYFKGEWVKQFDKDNTVKDSFYLSEDDAVAVNMMSQTGKNAEFLYGEDEFLQILEMPYNGKDLSMLILLPKDKKLDLMERRLNMEMLNEWQNDMREQRVDVYMPSFKFESKILMSQTLQKMGMYFAFSNNANFSAMTSDKDLKIDEVIHQAFVEVNEDGTEAAAATAVVMIDTTAVAPGPVIPVFRADHPFLFIIKHRDSGAILFMGRVMDPTQE